MFSIRDLFLFYSPFFNKYLSRYLILFHFLARFVFIVEELGTSTRGQSFVSAVQCFTAERQGDSDTTGSEFFFNNFGPVGKLIYVSLIHYYLEGWRLTLNKEVKIGTVKLKCSYFLDFCVA